MPRLLLLLPATSYRGKDFLQAARRLEIELIVASNHRPVLQAFTGSRTLTLEFTTIETSVAQIKACFQQQSFTAIVGTDQETILLAATASQALGLVCNSPEAVAVAHNKYHFRCALAQAGLPSPWFRLLSLGEDVTALAATIPYPCVLKPLNLSASRGVIRANSATEFIAACQRIQAIIQPEREILIETYIPGTEFALEGLLNQGQLQIYTLFDKPDPLEGPYFEETIYVTPARLTEPLQQQIIATTSEVAAVLGLREGPVHAELRVNQSGVWLLELAARSIGGLCSRALLFAQDMTLEELILRQAIGLPIDDLQREQQAAGVMMIPIPRAGYLQAVHGLAEARQVPGIEEIIISIACGEYVLPLPEGDRYLGFIFAKSGTPEAVEAALRQAWQKLYFDLS